MPGSFKTRSRAAELASLGVAAGLLAGTARGGDPAPGDYRLKAEFLCNFARFVEWPPGELARGRPIVIGVYRANPFGSALEETVAGRVINGHRVIVTQVHSAEAARAAQLLFVGASQEREAYALATSLKGNPVLTVGETEAFARAGGVIVFKPTPDGLRFTVNAAAAREAGLKISAQLQKLATAPEGAAPP